jgi:hypothetical protein
MGKLRSLTVSICLLVVTCGPASCSSTSSSEGDPGSGEGCSGACRRNAFDCKLTTADGELAGTAQVSAQAAQGCSGTLSVAGEVPGFWIHCDTGQICVDHMDECFAGTFTRTSFSYVVSDKGNTVTCHAGP